MTKWVVTAAHDDPRQASLTGAGLTLPCVLGRGGVVATADKSEGDGKTPLGRYPIRRAFFRPDRQIKPACHMPILQLSPDLGWCDDVAHKAYNHLVRLPFGGSYEKMWRDDGCYDLGLIIGHNDDPVSPGLGSAIFMHVAKTTEGGEMLPTSGCIALKCADIRQLLQYVMPEDLLMIEAN